MRRTPCHKGMSSCYYLKNLFVRAARSHLRQFFPFLFCLCCPVCRCRVYGRYTAGRSETLLRIAMDFSISFKKATLIPVRCLMYLLKCTCFSLCSRSAMSPVPISFQCHWERPWSIGNCEVWLGSMCILSFTLTLYLWSGNDSVLCSAHFPKLFFSCSHPCCFCLSFYSIVSLFSITFVALLLLFIVLQWVLCVHCFCYSLCHIIHLRTKLLPCKRNKKCVQSVLLNGVVICR